MPDRDRERKLEAEVERLKRQLEIAQTALEWYAGDGSTYDGIDVGQRARAVLSQLKDKPCT